MPWTTAALRPGLTLMEEELFLACRHLVPAAYTFDGAPPVTPGSINFDARVVTHDCYQSNDVLLDVEGYDYPKRDEDEAAQRLYETLKAIFPRHTFGPWTKLVKAGFRTDNPDDTSFDGDLGMDAAVERAKHDVETFRPLLRCNSRADALRMVLEGAY